jgi:hypothetical protein
MIAKPSDKWVWENTLPMTDVPPRRYRHELVATTLWERVVGWLKREGWNKQKFGPFIEVPPDSPEYELAPFEENILWSRAFLEAGRQNQAKPQ